jgi:phosphate-selective porin OprO/OprP
MALVFLAVGLVASGEEDTNVVTAAQVDENAGWESVFTPSNQVPFHINLYMKDGLYYELMESSHYQGAFYTSVFSEKRRLTGRLGAKLSLDGALYKETGNLPEANSGFYIRKFRVNTYGRAFFLSPLTFGLEFGVSDGSFFFNDGYLWFHRVPWIKSVKLGVFTSPMSMESLQSSSYIPLMEKAAPVSAFAPGDKLGIQMGGAVPNERATLYTGVFSDTVDTENTDSAKNAYRFMARSTWLPILGSGTNATSRFVHFGGSFSYVHSSRDDFQFRARPESFQAPFLIDTGKIPVSQTMIGAVEAAMQTGPLLLQSEFFFSDVGDIAGSAGHFWGGYVTAGFMLTGETRAYNRRGGHFSGIKPTRKFSFKKRSWGALEWASRASFTDLSDGSIEGGRMGVISTGLNCYLSERDRIMFNGGAARISDRPEVGDFYFIQCRFQIEL